jgi:kumamolisin
LRGTAAGLEKAFKVKLSRFRFKGLLYRANTTPVRVPRNLAGIIAAVQGFDTFPIPAAAKGGQVSKVGADGGFSLSTHTVPGSQPVLLGVRQAGTPPPTKVIRVSVLVRRPQGATAHRFATREAFLLPAERHYLTRQQFVSENRAAPQDVARIEGFARQHNLRIVRVKPAQRIVVLQGTVSNLERAFGLTLGRFQFKGRVYRSNTAPIHVPPQLAKIVKGVFGFDTTPIAQPRFHSLAGSSYTPPRVAQVYRFPATVKGRGQAIGLIELGGGYRTIDLSAYFNRLGISPAPRVISVGVDGATNAPTGNPNGPDGEVMLDIEVAGAVAPKALIVVYFAPNTSRGFIDAVNAAIHDTQNKPSVISISWGNPEKKWPAQVRNALNQAFLDAASLGISICAASGDNGSSDGLNDGQNHVDFPASSPNVLGCGGTHLEATRHIASVENGWPGSGGGFSNAFPMPSWQANAGISSRRPARSRKARGVPDVCGNADPATGYRVRVDGQNTIIGGTSAVAPLWAALIALINQRLGKSVGFLNPLLYGRLGSSVVRDITNGSNGAFHCHPGWDAVTGVGSPSGVNLLNALGGGSVPGPGGPGPGTGRPVVMLKPGQQLEIDGLSGGGPSPGRPGPGRPVGAQGHP